MRGKEVISYIHHDKVPDFDKVLEKCIMQSVITDTYNVGRKRATHKYKPGDISVPHHNNKVASHRPHRFSRLAASLVGFVLFCTVVFAVLTAYERFEYGGFSAVFPGRGEPYFQLDFGGSIVWEVVQNACLTGLDPPITSFSPLYVNINSDVIPSALSTCMNQRFCSDTIIAINEMIEGKVFRANGSAFVVRDAFPGQGQYFMQDTVLFDSYGHEIGMICGVYTYDRQLIGIRITTREQFEAEWGYRYSLAHVADFLWQDVYFPLLDGFNAPRFNLMHEVPTWQSGEGWIDVGVRAVSVRYIYTDRPWWSTEMAIFVENVRSDDEEPLVIRNYHIGSAGAITELDIAGMAVTKIANENVVHPRYNFIWTHNNLIFNFNPSYESTLEEAIEIVNKFLQ